MLPPVLGSGVLIALVNLADPSDIARSIVFNMLGVVAFGAAVFGVRRNRPVKRTVWWLIVGSLGLFVLGDIVYDAPRRRVRARHRLSVRRHPLPARVPGARDRADRRLARGASTGPPLIDSAVVAVTLSAVIWQWVVTPVLESSSGPQLERFVTVLYPLMDILLVVVIVHAVFTLPRWTAGRVVALRGAGTHAGRRRRVRAAHRRRHLHRRRVLDALWPIAYLLLAAAVMHPSMRALWESRDVELVRDGRARMVVLGAALFAVPASCSSTTPASSTRPSSWLCITGVAAVARRVAHHAARRRVEQRSRGCSPRAKRGSGPSCSTPPTS